MPETSGERIQRLKGNLRATVAIAQMRLKTAMVAFDRGHGFSLNTGPHAVLALLLDAESLSIRIEMLEQQ